ncbi:hypothetical protein GTY77_02050 [Streptomyces sp. SID8380]|nr:hypothetical protein [Streptomyces sp. SID8380]
MFDLKGEIRQALISNSALFSLLGGPHIYPLVSPDASLKTYITFQEITNFDKDYASDQALNSEIHFHFDIWSPYNTGPVAAEVNRTMEEQKFYRTSSQDGYDTASQTYRKILRYKTIKFGG